MEPSPERQKDPWRKQRAALASVFASAALSLAKLVAGLLSGSLALVSEGAHNLLDTGSSALTFFAVREADKPADEEHPFGHAKIEAVAALAQTGFLAVLSVAVAVEAIRRMGGDAPKVDANALALGVVLVSVAVDFIRWRALAKVARETKSDALAADALHYSSDLVSSLLVLIGLAATRFGFVQADALAAIGVAVFIAIASFRLGRHTIDALVDTAPKGLADRLRRAIEAVPGVASIDTIRLRPSGAQIIGEVGIFVSRTLPLERVAAIKGDVARRIEAEWPQTALTLTANPVALDDESLLERVQLIATRLRFAVHHITIQEVDGRKCVSLDMEVDGRLSLAEAHELATRLETAIEDEVGPDIEVETHIEPMETREIHGRDADSGLIAKITQTLSDNAALRGQLRNIHDVRVRHTPGGYFVNFHCSCDAKLSVDAAHDEVDALERSLRATFPDIIRIVGHAEPAPRPA
ncbi:MAG TPA: cation diffusion facilitator family transporter [Roseiarcus sp.]|jgi:cation diffusion facilitator family transporter